MVESSAPLGDEAAIQQELDALDRVLFRLASVTDERMLVVARSLLPQLLRLFPPTLATPLQQQLKDKVAPPTARSIARRVS